jgi:hypothetical protein
VAPGRQHVMNVPRYHTRVLERYKQPLAAIFQGASVRMVACSRVRRVARRQKCSTSITAGCVFGLPAACYSLSHHRERACVACHAVSDGRWVSARSSGQFRPWHRLRGQGGDATADDARREAASVPLRPPRVMHPAHGGGQDPALRVVGSTVACGQVRVAVCMSAHAFLRSWVLVHAACMRCAQSQLPRSHRSCCAVRVCFDSFGKEGGREHGATAAAFAREQEVCIRRGEAVRRSAPRWIGLDERHCCRP